MLSLYLGKAGKRANEVIDGSVIFSSVWNMSTGMPVFYKTAFGFWTYMLGKNHTGNIKKMLPRLKSLMPKKEFDELNNTLETNKTGMLHLDTHYYPKMFGYKSV